MFWYLFWYFNLLHIPHCLNWWLKNSLSDISLLWRSHSVTPKHPGKSKTPTEGHTTAAWGDHHYDVRTLEVDKPAVVVSVPLIWIDWKLCDADVNSRLGHARHICPAVLALIFLHHVLARLVPLSRCRLSLLLEEHSFTSPTKFIFSYTPTSTPSLFFSCSRVEFMFFIWFYYQGHFFQSILRVSTFYKTLFI